MLTSRLKASALVFLWTTGIVGTSSAWAQDFRKLVINEIMYHPPDGGAVPSQDLEFIEIVNTGNVALDLGGVAVTTGVSFTFTALTLLPPGQLVVVASNAAEFQTKYGFAPAGEFTGELSDDGALVTLESPSGLVIDVVSYADAPPWATEPDGSGASLELEDAALDNADPASWSASTLPDGTPGSRNSVAGPGPTRLILNEYNAVGPSGFLKNGRSDTFWGRVPGNGGDWFELVVTVDHLDVRGWDLVITDNNGPPETLTFTEDSIWSDLRSGTIITVSENLADDVSYDPVGDDWWINVQAATGAPGLYIEPQNFPVSNDNWQLTIRDRANQVVFGPAGEGVNPASGVGSDEVLKLEQNPTNAITPLSNYRDGSSSTFGSPNLFDGGTIVQDFTALRAAVPLGKPLLTSPTGAGIAETPTYTWSAVPRATAYFLWVEGPTGVPVVQMDVAACEGTCTVTPSVSLARGLHTFWVQAKNASGAGPWSVALRFVVGDLPPATTLDSPSGSGVSTTPTYRWSAVPGAIDYFLWVNDGSGNGVVTARVPQCADVTCEATPSQSLSSGLHSWWVQVRNDSGDGPWSNGMNFIVGGLPTAPTPLAPTGEGAATTPTFTWLAAAGALTYELQVNSPSGVPVLQTTVPATVCIEDTCTATPSVILPPGGLYTWWVRGRNDSGGGAWSSGLNFTVGFRPTAPTILAPTGNGISSNPTYTWTPVPGATHYFLWVANALGTPVVLEIVPASVCTDSVCVVTPSTSLGIGLHSWYVQGQNASGGGAWSNGLNFVVSGGT